MHIDFREYIVSGTSGLAPTVTLGLEPTKERETVSKKLEHLLPQVGKGELYLPAKIPFSWLSAAGSLSGKALAVGLFAWWRVTIERNAIVALSCSKAAKLFHVSPETIRRAVDALEAACLLEVVRGSGRSPRVRLLNAPVPLNIPRAAEKGD